MQANLLKFTIAKWKINITFQTAVLKQALTTLFHQDTPLFLPPQHLTLTHTMKLWKLTLLAT